MSQPIRPSVKELTTKLKVAEELLRQKDGLFADPGKAVGELNALGIGDSKEIWELIKAILPEIKAEDYTGGRPPQKSYEKTIEGKELFAFSWNCMRLDKKMYLKFAIKGDRFVYVSLHEDKPPQSKKGRFQ